MHLKFNKLYIFLFTFSISCSAQHVMQRNNISRIIGGERAEPKQFPFVVSVIVLSKPSVCTGSIIDERWVITSAWCFKNYKEVPKKPILVKAAEITYREKDNHTQTRKGDRFIIHPYFGKRSSYEFDLALVTFKQRFRFNAYVRPITIANQRFPTDNMVQCEIVGFGNTGKNAAGGMYLNYMKISAGGPGFCDKRQGSSKARKEWVCIQPGPNGSLPCGRDSGGPLVCNGLLAGVLTGTTLAQKSCTSTLDVVYNSPVYFESWIDKYVTSRKKSSKKKKKKKKNGTTRLEVHRIFKISASVLLPACSYFTLML